MRIRTPSHEFFEDDGSGHFTSTGQAILSSCGQTFTNLVHADALSRSHCSAAVVFSIAGRSMKQNARQDRIRSAGITAATTAQCPNTDSRFEPALPTTP